MMSRIILLIGIGGGLGSISRYLISVFITKNYPSAFPYGTFFINILGSFLIGLIFGLSERFNWFTPELRLFFATGFCGGFTTFSTFSNESVLLLKDGNFFLFFIYIGLSIILGLAATFLGHLLIKIF